MKRLRRILLIIVLSIPVILIALAVIAKLKENEITDIAVKKVSETINAPMLIDNVSFNLIRRFPLATIEFEGVRLGEAFHGSYIDSTSAFPDTLASINKLYISVKSTPLIDGNFEIMKVEIIDGNINYTINNDGISNFDFLFGPKSKEKSDTTKSQSNIVLNQLELKNIQCTFYDSSRNAKGNLTIPDLSISGSMVDSIYEGAVSGDIILTECAFGETSLNRMKQTNIKIDVDYSNDSILLKNIDIVTDGAHLNIQGSSLISEGFDSRLKVTGNNINISEIKKYVPHKILKEHEIKTIAGKLNFESKIEGQLTDSTSALPHIDLKFYLDNAKFSKSGFPAAKNISLKGSYSNGFLNNAQTTTIEISEFHLESQDSKIDASISIQNLDKPKYLINSWFELELSNFEEFIPDSVIHITSGKMLADISTKGILPDSIDSTFVDYLLETSKMELEFNKVNLQIDTAIAVDSVTGTLKYSDHNVSVKNLSAYLPTFDQHINNITFSALYKGEINEPGSIGINLEKLFIKAGNNSIAGNASVSNLIAPTYKLHSNISIDLNDLQKYVPDSIISSSSGNLAATIISQGTVSTDSISGQVMDLVLDSSSYKFRFKQISLKTPDSLLLVKNLTGNASVKPNEINIGHLKGKYGNIEFGIESANLKNINSVFIENSLYDTLLISGNYSLGDINHKSLLPLLATKNKPDKINEPRKEEIEPTSSKKNNENQNLKYKIIGKLSINSIAYDKRFIDNISNLTNLQDTVKSMLYGYLNDKIVIKDISSLFYLKDSLYIIDQFKFSTFNGSINSSLKYSIQSDGNTKINIKNHINNMDIKKLLKDCNSFNQSSFTHNNITGFISAKFDSEFELKDGLIQSKKTRVRGKDIILKNGQLIEFEQAKELSGFTGIQELYNARFKTLTCNFFIYKNRIYVPQTDIVSTAFDISAFGMKSFGEDYEYHLNIHPLQILSGKSKKLLEEQEKMGDVAEDDGRKSIMVTSYSLDGKTKQGHSKKDSRKKINNKIDVAKGQLKFRFIPDMVSYNTGVTSNK